MSDTTIKRLVPSGLLKVEQVAPWAPWEMRRTDLEAAAGMAVAETVPSRAPAYACRTTPTMPTLILLGSGLAALAGGGFVRRCR